MADTAPHETNQTPPTGVTTRAQRAQGAGAGSGGDSDGNRNATSDERYAALQQQLNAVQADAAAAAAENASLRQAQFQVAPPETPDITKVLKAARFVKKLDGITRSAGAWAEYYSDLRTSTLSSAPIRACLTHVESNAEDTLSTPNGTAADHALFTLLQATTTGLAHAIVTGLERSASGYSVSGIKALRQLKDAVQPSTLGDFYAAVRAVAIPNLSISARHDPRIHLIRYITEVKTLDVSTK
jgi:hypothetical protein